METQQHRRRSSDRRSGRDRRRPHTTSATWLFPNWHDQRLQYFVRYLFTLLGVAYFNLGFEYQSPWLTLDQMNIFFVSYLVWISLTLLHAHYIQFSPLRLRITMWSDIFGIALVVLNDPFLVPLTGLVWIIIALGNGMRYGIRCFTEALVGCFVVASLTLLMRYTSDLDQVLSGLLFLAIFSSLILIYAYVLMQRIHESHQLIEEQSRTDTLTDLLNRGALIEAAQQMIDHARLAERKLVVMFADLDRFKAINDQLGHIVGDQVLSQISSILRSMIRETDIAARYGGDEFVLVLDDVDGETAQFIGKRLQNSIEQWAQQEGYDLSVSIGIGEAPTHGTDILNLLHEVDQAMYRCKYQEGRGGIALVTTGMGS